MFLCRYRLGRRQKYRKQAKLATRQDLQGCKNNSTSLNEHPYNECFQDLSKNADNDSHHYLALSNAQHDVEYIEIFPNYDGSLSNAQPEFVYTEILHMDYVLPEVEYTKNNAQSANVEILPNDDIYGPNNLNNI